MAEAAAGKGAGLLLEDPRDHAEIARAFERIRDDPAIRQSLRESGLKRARQFTIGRMATDTLAVYERLIR